MSQKKVLDYREEKKNRKETLKKKKRQALLGKIGAGVAALALIGVIAFAVVEYSSSKGEGTDAHNVRLSTLNDYVGTLNMDEAMASFDSEEE